MPAPIQHVATNVISGFLGAGKTTAILHLFAQKPAAETWAVLVNEFGSIGIDGKRYQAERIAVKEIPGGCMCCAQGLPLQVAINQLLKQARPDRLLIESSGVGHPSGVLKTLRGEGFSQVLSLRAAICLIDPMHLLDARYHNNALFLEQIQLADVLVANKTDMATATAMQAFDALARKLQAGKALITQTTFGQLETDWLALAHTRQQTATVFRLHEDEQTWQSHSFQFDEASVFDHDALLQWLQNQTLMRIKGWVVTTKGEHAANATPAQAALSPLPGGQPPRYRNLLEIIDTRLDVERIHASLSCCLKKSA